MTGGGGQLTGGGGYLPFTVCGRYKIDRVVLTGWAWERQDSVIQWLEDLRLMTETECMCVLQGKSLTKEPFDSVALLAKSTKGNS